MEANMNKKKINYLWCWLLAFLAIGLNGWIVYEIFNSSKFSALSQNLFIKGILAVIVVLFLLDALVLWTLRKRNKVSVILSWLVLSLLIGAVGYSSFFLGKVNENVTKITSSTKEGAIQVSFVVLTENKESIKDENALINRKIGYVPNTEVSETGKDRLKSNNISADYKEYADITELMAALFSKEIEAAILPATYQQQFSNDENLMAKLEKTTSILTFSKKITQEVEEGASKDITKEPFTILLTGENQGLADTIMLASINPVSMKVVLTSIARDSYVPISCNNGAREKINSAHVYGEACMVKTVEKLTGIPIDYTAQFNFASVIQIVDAVGGVDMDVEATFVAQSWDVESDKLVAYYLHKGPQHLSGQDALGYVRERHAFPDGDFARQRHQQELISLVMKKIVETGDANTLLKVLDAAGSNFKTNVNVNQMLSFFKLLNQKGSRFYDPTNKAGVLDLYTSRITGYSSTVYNSQLGLDLWIYPLYQGSIKDIRTAHEENLNLNREFKSPTNWSWSIAKPYVRPNISKEVYYESKLKTAQRPVQAPTQSAEQKTTNYSTSSNSNGTTQEKSPATTTTPSTETTTSHQTQPAVAPASDSTTKVQP